MSYEEKSIHEVVTEIDAGKYYLPAIQRKFVWNEERITLLFDSILRGYPLGTFLFWFLKKRKADEYVFYEFLKHYDERDPFNKRKDGYFTQDEIIGVLDGQQRLSSIYIGLQGKYITKTKYKRHDNPSAWPERKLYINLLNTPFELDYHLDDMPQVLIQEDKSFEIEFREPTDIVQRYYKDQEGKTHFEYWFKFGEVIRWNENTSPNDVFEAILDKSTNEVIKNELNSQKRFVIKLIESLRDKFIKEKIINYFKTNKEDLEAILNIFVRVNSGAVTLSKSDLLFSTIIATWENGREEIEALQKDINKKGDGFEFTNDFIMRSLLVIMDLNVLFKVKSFKSSNVQLIKSNWSSIRKAILDTVDLLVGAGFSGWIIPSQNAVIPIAYYIYKKGQLTYETKNDLIKYLKHAFIKNVFGSQGDSTLNSIRNALREKVESGFKLRNNHFNFDGFITELELNGDKSLVISEEDLDELLEAKKGIYSFILLSIVYPHFKFGQMKLHQDHIHPHSGFKIDVLTSYGLNEDQIKMWLNKRDMLPNLQLMEGSENQSKNDATFKDWLNSEFPINHDAGKKRVAFLERNYIDVSWSLELQDFDIFFNERKLKLKSVLMDVLQIK